MGRHTLQLPVRPPEPMRSGRERLYRLSRTVSGYFERYISLRSHHADKDERIMQFGYALWLISVSLIALAELIFLVAVMWDMMR